jgi:hypothetical protein
MADLFAAAVQVAEQEWKAWGKSSWNCITGKKSSGFHSDDEDRWSQYVIDTYLTHFYKKPIRWPTRILISEDDYPWSAVTISHFFLSAGFKAKPLLSGRPTPAQFETWAASSNKAEFPASQGHSDYIRWSIAARRAKAKNAAYWGYRADEPDAIPEVGDLVGYPRAKGVKLTKAKALAYFDRTGSYTSHTDLVVAKRPGEIDVIGGNVRDSVTRKTLRIGPDGRLADTSHAWFVVMKLRP